MHHSVFACHICSMIWLSKATVQSQGLVVILVCLWRKAWMPSRPKLQKIADHTSSRDCTSHPRKFRVSPYPLSSSSSESSLNVFGRKRLFRGAYNGPVSPAQNAIFLSLGPRITHSDPGPQESVGRQRSWRFASSAYICQVSMLKKFRSSPPLNRRFRGLYTGTSIP